MRLHYECHFRDDRNNGLVDPKLVAFDVVHRRIEWFMHFFIDAMSSIEVDPRWRAFMPIRFFSDPSPLERLRLDDLAHSATENKEATLHDRAAKVVEEFPSLSLATQNKFIASLSSSGGTAAAGDQSLITSQSAVELLDLALAEPREPFEVLGLVTVHQVSSPFVRSSVRSSVRSITSLLIISSSRYREIERDYLSSSFSLIDRN